MPIIVADENGIHEINNDNNIICPECNCTNESYRVRCKNCSQKLISFTELTYKQEDYLIEYGMEKEREKKCANTKI